MQIEPHKEHRWLRKLVGEWTTEGDMATGPGQAPAKWTGCESVRSLGELWVLAEGRSEMPGGVMATALLTLGYDPQRKQFVGTFIASMMTHLWVYESGELDSAEKVLTLYAEGPNPEGKMVKYKDVMEFKSDDHRVLSSHVMDEDGVWHPFMTAEYHRVRR